MTVCETQGHSFNEHKDCDDCRFHQPVTSMTNQEIASQALEVDVQRRNAWARGDYTQSRELLLERNELIMKLDVGYSDRRLVKLFKGN